MVRINLINPKYLADQHLIAEYNEILMLFGYVRKYPSLDAQPTKYQLGEGHILFFKNKLRYLKARYQIIEKEMKKRGFTPTKLIDLSAFNPVLLHNWAPSKEDYKIIKERLKEKLELKPNYYTFYRKKHNLSFFLHLLDSA